MNYRDVQPNVAESGTSMEYGSIKREIHVDASVGATGHITFHRAAPEEALVVPITVVDARPPHRFSFRWVYEAGTLPGPENSLLVTFDLEPSGTGTRVRMTETGFRERGWDAAVLEQAYQEHIEGWDHFVPRLGAYVARLVSS
jgi:uncharacterized protein YndB with AHSA1/START domain